MLRNMELNGFSLVYNLDVGADLCVSNEKVVQYQLADLSRESEQPGRCRSRIVGFVHGGGFA